MHCAVQATGVLNRDPSLAGIGAEADDFDAPRELQIAGCKPAEAHMYIYFEALCPMAS